MSLKHAMLGFLCVEDMNGYQLKKHFDESISQFWSASISQIYPTLNDMLGAGLIVIGNSSEDDSRGSKIYRITEKGKEELRQWLLAPAKKEPFRSEMLVKLYFSANIDSKTVICHLSEQKNEAEKQLEFYNACLQHIETEHRDDNTFKKDAVYWQMTVRYGISRSKALSDWCDDCVALLQNIIKPDSDKTQLDDILKK